MKTIHLLCIWLGAFLPTAFCPAQNETTKSVFRFHSGLEPATVDPAALNDATGGFLFFNLYRSLYRLDEHNRPKLELAKKCDWLDSRLRLRLRCQLKSGLKFSNGENMTANHWVLAWRRLIDPMTGSRHAELLQPILNARAISAGKLKPEDLGVSAIDDRTLEIQLEEADPELFFKLSAPVLTPIWQTPPLKPDTFAKAVTTGPYRIREWQSKTRIRLEPNPYYFPIKSRPEVEILLIEEDSTALQMFDLGKLDFLRRLNIKEIPWRKSRKEFLFIPTYRFDYVGFGPELQDQPELRKALALSLDYAELTKAYLTPGKIGCPSLPRSLSEPWPCVKFDLKAAKAALAKADRSRFPELTLNYSRAGGEDVGRGMEWMQGQWKKHLGLNVALRPQESGMFMQQIKTKAPALFRKGMNLNRPTCLAALESFTSFSRDNSLGLKNENYDKLVGRLQNSQSEPSKKSLCGQALNLLIKEHRLIPLGELYFAMLAKPQFRGWRVTPMNQLDLTDLEVTPPKPKDGP
ncbi:MAG: peptide ABC transporter substrate-binding protein [Bdellovibrionales bacterium]